MAEMRDIPVAELDLDQSNPRIPGSPTTQQQTAVQLAEHHAPALLEISQHILEHGMDPLTLVGVVAKGSGGGPPYRVLEGNRRVLALQSLEHPGLVAPALTSAQNKKMEALAARYATNPISTVNCIVFASDAEAEEWIILRHTGSNRGAGLVSWGTVEQDRFKERHTGRRSTAGQISDFVEDAGLLSDKAKESDQKVATILQRLVNTPDVRRRIGVEVKDGEVLSYFPREETAKVLSRIYEDVKLRRVTVKSLYHVDDRQRYANSLPDDVLPDPSSRLSVPAPLAGLPPRGAGKPSKPAKSKKAKPAAKTRTCLCPTGVPFDVIGLRERAILHELQNLQLDRFPNAAAVLFRVFVEMSVDHAVTELKIMTEEQALSTKLAKRMEAVASELKNRAAIPEDLRRAVSVMAGKQYLGVSTVTLNQYVHNSKVFPSAVDMQGHWDEIQPFLEAIWPAGGLQ